MLRRWWRTGGGRSRIVFTKPLGLLGGRGFRSGVQGTSQPLARMCRVPNCYWCENNDVVVNMGGDMYMKYKNCKLLRRLTRRAGKTLSRWEMIRPITRAIGKLDAFDS